MRAKGSLIASVCLAACASIAALPEVAAARTPEEVERAAAWKQRVEAAADFARRRRGSVAFAVSDESGRLRSHRGGERFVSASVVKAMLLVADLSVPWQRARPLEPRVRRELGPMIRRSSNRTADRVYARVGDAGLLALARRAGMRSFGVEGHWSRARITASDQARFAARLNELLPDRHRDYARTLLAGVVREQRWGIPRAAPPGWLVLFKGGWRRAARGRIVHQVARLEGAGTSVSLAVLSAGSPSHSYGTRTVRGVALRLLTGVGAPAPVQQQP